MPFIIVHVTKGAIPADARAQTAEALTSAIMKVETGGHDKPSFRAISALVLNEVEATAWAVGGAFDQGASAVVEIRVPEGAVDDEKRAAMARESYACLAASSPALRDADGTRRVWSHIIEIKEGNWGAGGRTVRLSDIAAIGLAGH
jgi:phenylpyruvate tautomerase PptA (4-oxalocrotonate tautomerase family)